MSKNSKTPKKRRNNKLKNEISLGFNYGLAGDEVRENEANRSSGMKSAQKTDYYLQKADEKKELYNNTEAYNNEKGKPRENNNTNTNAYHDKENKKVEPLISIKQNGNENFFIDSSISISDDISQKLSSLTLEPKEDLNSPTNSIPSIATDPFGLIQSNSIFPLSSPDSQIGFPNQGSFSLEQQDTLNRPLWNMPGYDQAETTLAGPIASSLNNDLALPFMSNSSDLGVINDFGSAGLDDYDFHSSSISLGLEQASISNPIKSPIFSPFPEIAETNSNLISPQPTMISEKIVTETGNHSPSPPAKVETTSPTNAEFSKSPTQSSLSSASTSNIQIKKPKTQICRYFLQGNCMRGENCSFSHDISAYEAEMGSKSPKFQSNSLSNSKSSSVSSRRANHRASNNDDNSIDDPSSLKGHIYDLCKDQQGCRNLQRMLEDDDPYITNMIFDEVLDHIVKLMSDPFGNYLCQKLFDYCTDEQRLKIVKIISNDLVNISINMHGTRAAQKLIDLLKNNEEIKIVCNALSNHVVQLIQDLNGNHVIQRCLNKLPPKSTQFIYDAVTQEGNIIAVATHRHGCCVLQRCIDSASTEQKMQLVNEIIRNALPLVRDPFGNYVVQYVLELHFDGIASRLVNSLKGHIAELSMQKFSSNVMEKIVQKSDEATRTEIINDIINYDDFKSLLSDPFANYVIQTCMNYANDYQHESLVEKIRPYQNTLRNTPYGKKILNIIMKEYH